MKPEERAIELYKALAGTGIIQEVYLQDRSAMIQAAAQITAAEIIAEAIKSCPTAIAEAIKMYPPTIHIPKEGPPQRI